MLSTSLSLAFAALLGLANAASNDEWAMRSVYQVIVDRFARTNDSDATCDINNYCGGTWAGLASNLDYIQDMGFTAIQISPIQRNLDNTTEFGQAYHGYWTQSLYDLNPNFGTEEDLKNLITQIHNRGMYILLDVVANEFAYDLGDANMTDSTVIDYNVFDPFNQAAEYDAYCPIVDWSNVSQYQTCWLGYEGVATPHFNLSLPSVTNVLNSWVHGLIANYSIDGIRLDGAKQMIYDFMPPFVKSAGVYTMAEVDDAVASDVCAYSNLTGGMENYPTYYTILSAFTAGNISGLVDMVGTMRKDCPDVQYLANFIENQDNPRFASYTDDIALAENAMAFTILADGIPKIYYGQEQHLAGNYSPYNRQPLWESSKNTTAPLYTLAKNLNTIRNHAINVNSNYVNNNSIILYTDGSTYATRKGPNGVQIVSVLSNQGSKGGSYQLSVPGAADPGTNLTEISTCDTVVAGQNGTIVVPMGQGGSRVYFPTFNMNGSGLCGTQATKTSVNGTSTSTGSGSKSTHTKHSAAESLRIPGYFTLVLGALSFVFLL